MASSILNESIIGIYMSPLCVAFVLLFCGKMTYLSTKLLCFVALGRGFFRSTYSGFCWQIVKPNN
jgi:hypothetical protein